MAETEISSEVGFETVPDLAEWLRNSGLRSVVMLGQSALTPDDVHFIVVNLDKDSVAEISYAAGEVMMPTLARALQQYGLMDDPAPKKPFERRRRR